MKNSMTEANAVRKIAKKTKRDSGFLATKTPNKHPIQSTGLTIANASKLRWIFPAKLPPIRKAEKKAMRRKNHFMNTNHLAHLSLKNP